MRNAPGWVAAACLSLAFLAGSCSVQPLASDSSVTPQLTSSANVPLANLLPTIASTAIQATAPVATTPTARVFLPPDADALIFHDDFSSSQADWSLESGTQGISTLADGILVLTVRAPYTSLESRLPAAIPDDFYAEVTARAVLCGADNDSFGLAFRVQGAEEYRLVITCGGMMRFEHQTGNAMTGANQWTTSSALLPGAPAENRIGILARGMEFQFMINGIVGFTFRDPVLASGKMAVFLRTEKGQLCTVSFDDLSVYTLKAKTS
jgi:hypothetical protein